MMVRSQMEAAISENDLLRSKENWIISGLQVRVQYCFTIGPIY
jgi:hypothetical protein